MHGLQTGIVVDNVHGMSVCLMVITMSCAKTTESLQTPAYLGACSGGHKNHVSSVWSTSPEVARLCFAFPPSVVHVVVNIL